MVEHEKRRRGILEKALDVFTEEGFERATFQKIASRCGFTRTTLYSYFRNKQEIFFYSIKQMPGKVEEDILAIRRDQGLRAADRIIKVILTIIERLEEYRRLLSVVLDYLLYLPQSEAAPDVRIRRRTVRLRHFLATMVIEGIRAGEIIPLDIRAADELLYGLIEAAIYRLAVLRREAVPELKQTIPLVVRQLCTGKS
ncbi:MAG: TetR/AcrR family transcriptional regulator [Treponema sp.]|nr:TetR/AcrR family transcriptional regulator [Treponema sp.]